MLEFVLSSFSFSFASADLLENMLEIFTVLKIQLALSQYKAQRLFHRQSQRWTVNTHDYNALKLYTYVTCSEHRNNVNCKSWWTVSVVRGRISDSNYERHNLLHIHLTPTNKLLLPPLFMPPCRFCTFSLTFCTCLWIPWLFTSWKRVSWDVGLSALKLEQSWVTEVIGHPTFWPVWY